jgi:predicted nucleic acid-binding protein
MSEALRDVDWFVSEFDILEYGPGVTRQLVELCREVPVAGRQVHDANIVATMLAHAEQRLLTFDQDDFLRYGDRISLVDPALSD